MGDYNDIKAKNFENTSPAMNREGIQILPKPSDSYQKGADLTQKDLEQAPEPRDNPFG